MFWKNTTEESEEVKRLNDSMEHYQKERVEMKKDHDRLVENLNKDHDIILKRKEAELDVKISEKSKQQTDKIASLTLENGNYKKEVEILTTAFKNLGFDVKDMKEILNKLVDGVVSKNTINVVK